MTHFNSTPFRRSEVELREGIRLRYLEAGNGPPIVLLPGWSQTAIQFHHQLAELSRDWRVIALDWRGHGMSDKPNCGYRLSRFAMDLREWLDLLGLDRAILLGHSLGAAVIWCFWEMFGAYRTSGFIFVDQSPLLIEQAYGDEPSWAAARPLLAVEELSTTIRELSGPQGEEATRQMLSAMVSPTMTAEELRWLLEMNLLMPRPYAARLLYSCATSDWRDVIPHISLPTLIVSGRGSHIPWESQLWIHKQIAGSHIVFIEEDEGGRHFMFMENPSKFNACICSHLRRWKESS